MLDQIADPEGARQGAGRGHGRQAAPERRVRRQGRPPAADRRRGRERRGRPDAGRREVPGREHARGHQGRRGRAREAAAGTRRHADGHVRLPARDLHRGRDRQHHATRSDRRRAAGAGAGRIPVPVAHGADRARDDPGVAGHGGARARPPGRDVQRDLVRGACGRTRAGDRRGGRGRRERRPPPARTPRGGRATSRSPRSSPKPRARCAARWRTRP